MENIVVEDIVQFKLNKNNIFLICMLICCESFVMSVLFDFVPCGDI